MLISDPNFEFKLRQELPAEEVHLWQIDLAEVATGEARFLPALSADERQRAGRFHFERDRHRYTVTRGVLRMLLGSYLGADPAQLVFAYSKHEKPFLPPDATSNKPSIEFNVSHSGAVAMLAFSRERAVGVDVEMIRPDRDHAAIAKRFFSEHEQAQHAALPESERSHAFFRCWTRKEAFIKAIGSGLSMPLGQFDVSLRPSEQNGLLATRPDGREASQWSLRDIPAPEGYVAALCVRGQGWQLKM